MEAVFKQIHDSKMEILRSFERHEAANTVIFDRIDASLSKFRDTLMRLERLEERMTVVEKKLVLRNHPKNDAI